MTAWLVAAACGPRAATQSEPVVRAPSVAFSATPPSATAAAERPAPASAPVTSDPSTKLVFVEDDYEKARAEALKKGAPLFVDVWASWCHSCVSMKEVVFPDPAMGRLKDAFVWLSIDSENEKNTAFLERFPARSLPTLWVLDAKSEAPRWKWIGAATAAELAALLEDAQKSSGQSGGDANSKGDEATVLLVRANEASAAGHAEQAINLYRQALRLGKAEWARRPNALEALSQRLRELGRTSDALDLAVRELPSMPRGTPRVNVLMNGIDAAAALPDGKAVRSAFTQLTALGVRIAEDADEPILVDDRSGLFLSLVSVFRQTNPAEAKRLAVEWVAMLEAEAKRDPPERRRVWDSHRLEAYLVLGEPECAVPMLEQSEREVPGDYNPPARLARAYFALGRHELAERAIARALERASGPRKIRMYMQQADIALALKKPADARAALQGALEYTRAAKLPREYDGLRQAVEKRLQAIR